MENNEEIIKFVEDCISIELTEEKIGDLKRLFVHYVPVSNIDQYNHLTIAQYIIYFKIERMEKLKLIPRKVRDELIELYDKYLEIGEQIGEEAYKEMVTKGYKSDNLKELHSVFHRIKLKLSEYCLDDDNFDLQQIIDNQIISEFKDKEGKGFYDVKNDIFYNQSYLDSTSDYEISETKGTSVKKLIKE